MFKLGNIRLAPTLFNDMEILRTYGNRTVSDIKYVFNFYMNSVQNTLLFCKSDEGARRDACGPSYEVVIPFSGLKLEVKFFSIKFYENPSSCS
jgi:hypothetical protein